MNHILTRLRNLLRPRIIVHLVHPDTNPSARYAFVIDPSRPVHQQIGIPDERIDEIKNHIAHAIAYYTDDVQASENLLNALQPRNHVETMIAFTLFGVMIEQQRRAHMERKILQRLADQGEI